MQSPVRDHRLSLDRIAAAAAIIDPVFLDTPQYRAEPIESRLGCRIVVKVETINPIRSFKGRGAGYLVSGLEGRPHLVCATAGNFGQGMAYAARSRGLPLTIFTSAGASALKIARMQALGADVRPVGADYDDAHRAASAFARQVGGRLVEDGRDAAIAEGAGTIAVELLRRPEAFDDIVVPVGDGALIGGVARWVKAHRPPTRVIGVAAAGAPAIERSWRAGRARALESADTIADGISIRIPFAEAVTDMIGLVDDILLVQDDQMIAAMRLAFDELGVVLEPSGAAGLAALMANRSRFEGRSTATILTGANLSAAQMRQWLA